MSRKARLAVIGLGPMGRDLMQEAMRNPRSEVVAVCDVDASVMALARKAASEVDDNAPREYADYPTMLAEEQLDGVIVAVPQSLHASVSMDVMRSGRACFCEKPMGLSVEECERMIGVSRETGQPLMIGQVLRYISVFRYLIDDVTSGKYGKPVAVRIIRSMGRWGGWMRPWRCVGEECGGLLLEVNVHEIDLMRQILGEAATVQAIGAHLANPEIDYEDFISVNVTFRNGGLGVLTVSSCDAIGHCSGEILLEKAALYYESLTSKVIIAEYGQERREIPYDEIGKDWEGGVYREIREFVETILDGKPVTIPGEEGMRNVALALAAYESIREGMTVLVNS